MGLKFGRWELGIGFENPFKKMSGFEILSINWEIGWAYFLTICNIIISVSLTDEEMDRLTNIYMEDLSKTEQRLRDLGHID